jgi:hypothetical protein
MPRSRCEQKAEENGERESDARLFLAACENSYYRRIELNRANEGSGQDSVFPHVIVVLSAYRNGRVCRQFIFHDGSEREEGVA